MESENVTRVNIIDIRMPFWSMVIFMVKAAIASIPAFIILSVIGSVVFAVLGAILGGMHHYY
ncbi:MAG: hypothetical protein KF909_12350 [Rhodocyclaceae bacterium]|nr:hypothetical protein [Rhodocyclaceae bacterium]MCP5233459.1 hypothetical protein [Zoogloeaceae bacterium]MCP5441370.1 hypothetical protein [Chromatiaceae bacterium]MCP5241595.1 hypothetical protein [Zoogloeaceae bacterium]MCP5252821.1 hypothetical protein [Zoogloeaceae bacterium]